MSEIPPPLAGSIAVRPWVDPVVDDDGFDPRSRYVEVFWLGVLGPTATWLLRRLVAGLERSPDGYELDLQATAQAMGLGYTSGRTSPFSKALQRCVMFGLAHPIDGGLAVRRRVPPISFRHLRRMPESVQAAHDDWLSASIGVDELTRAHRLATTMLDLGDDPSEIEHHLVALGVADAVAAEAADNAARLGQDLRPAG
ncbi:MAG TPA: hypothetical protein VMW33_00150 [Ilumatobacteraceae bacterium]|jgi:hypothetical protein|nr:hypothetical protein [Ilumatobacteraceae bacterium]